MQKAEKNHTDKKLKPGFESLLERVSSGKESMTRHKNIEEFIEDVDKITSEE